MYIRLKCCLNGCCKTDVIQLEVVTGCWVGLLNSECYTQFNKTVVDGHVIEPHIIFGVNCTIAFFRSEVRDSKKCNRGTLNI